MGDDCRDHAARGWDTSKIIASGQLCKQHGVDAINIPDGPRAAPRLSALVTALKLQGS